ncbi:hypothetical protein MF271_15365 [Deinococcus sp. KNUC1210]|uniref:hypothetical protein n=1 Tax=Deinococcus sp. KNUC1210 TaxID=2917691 RepID=UPI001EEFD292|nr:hypothetical protein [Deinococcus sp. KNUC1210]ULH15305.1 hypothetical protein MF271_15365 [Deinococcus sp. KNUC1210]
MFNLPVQKNDLTREVPPGLLLKGFSEPVFDGVNYFRRLEPAGGTLSFTLTRPGYLQLNLQPYSNETFELAIKLDGKIIADLRPIAKAFSTSTFVIPASSGTHTFAISAKCGRLSCKSDAISVYWLKLDRLTSPDPVKQVGWHAVEWRGDGIDSPLSVSGTTDVQFDGINLYRKMTAPVKILWNNKSALSLNFETFTPKTLAHTVQVKGGGKIIYRKDVGGGIFFNHQVDLKKYPTVREITVEVTCNQQICQKAQLYFPRLVISTVTPGQGPAANLPLTLILLVLLLGVFGWWFKLVGRSSLGRTA